MQNYISETDIGTDHLQREDIVVEDEGCTMRAGWTGVSSSNLE